MHSRSQLTKLGWWNSLGEVAPLLCSLRSHMEIKLCVLPLIFDLHPYTYSISYLLPRRVFLRRRFISTYSLGTCKYVSHRGNERADHWLAKKSSRSGAWHSLALQVSVETAKKTVWGVKAWLDNYINIHQVQLVYRLNVTWAAWLIKSRTRDLSFGLRDTMNSQM